jgi:hypothetical protein
LIGRFASKEDAKNFIKIKNFKNAFIVKDWDEFNRKKD